MAQAIRREDSKDSALFRVAKNVGFNARVEPMWLAFRHLSEGMGFLQRWKEKRRLKRLVADINARLKRSGVAADGWDDVGGKCVSNLRVAKIGVIAGLLKHLGAHVPSERVTAWRHLLAQRDHNSIILPLEFPEPFSIPTGPGDVAVSSAPCLKLELEEVNQALHSEASFALDKMSKIDFVDANERDIAIYESRFATLDDFWPRFAYILLKKLADKSVQSGLPVLFA